jgi:hypothetical protein
MAKHAIPSSGSHIRAQQIKQETITLQFIPMGPVIEKQHAFQASPAGRGRTLPRMV